MNVSEHGAGRGRNRTRDGRPSASPTVNSGNADHLQESMQMSADRVRLRVIVSGRVQGVFFRHSACEVAAEHGVGGWVRNRPDGTVEAVVEGEPLAVAAVVHFLRQGPPRARVDDVEVHEETAEGLSEFLVR
jgi:acylphosphatase